jgi:putative hydrolase of the HAD superfamily
VRNASPTAGFNNPPHPANVVPLDLRRIRAVLFDLDDTLINWREAEDLAMRDLAASHLEPLGATSSEVLRVYAGVMEENFRAFRANGQWWYIADRLRLLVQRLGLDGRLAPEALSDAFKERSTHHLALLDGALEAVAAAHRSGRKVGMLTNGPSLVQRPKVNAMDLERHFHFVGISGELGAWKPHPDAFHRALAPLGVAPEAALMVGDSLEFDILPAKALGMQTCWVTTTAKDHAHADLVVAGPAHLASHLA